MRKITLLIYNINREKTPFVTIGMIHGKSFELPMIELEEDIPYEKDEYIIQLSKEYLQTILSSYLDVEIEYVDEFYEEENLLLIFKITMNHKNSYAITSVTKIWFATLHEIININNFCNISFSENTIKQVKTYLNYYAGFENPITKYDGSHSKKIMFESTFGVSKRDEDDGQGNVYRFYDFFNAYDRAKETNKASAVLRYVVFSKDEITYDDFLPLTLHPLPLQGENYLLM